MLSLNSRNSYKHPICTTSFHIPLTTLCSLHISMIKISSFVVVSMLTLSMSVMSRSCMRLKAIKRFPLTGRIHSPQKIICLAQSLRSLSTWIKGVTLTWAPSFPWASFLMFFYSEAEGTTTKLSNIVKNTASMKVTLISKLEKWIEIAPMNIPRSTGFSLIYRSKIYVFGGYTS